MGLRFAGSTVFVQFRPQQRKYDKEYVDYSPHIWMKVHFFILQ